MNLTITCPCLLASSNLEEDSFPCDGWLTVNNIQYYRADRDVGLGPELDWESITAECGHEDYENWDDRTQQRFMDRLYEEYEGYYDPS